jgi:protein-serine/threonine kinase
VTAGDLLSFIRYKGGTLVASEAAFITRQILLSLEAGGRVVLTDFGCAKEVTQPAKRMQTIVGTYEYCAP